MNGQTVCHICGNLITECECGRRKRSQYQGYKNITFKTEWEYLPPKAKKVSKEPVPQYDGTGNLLNETELLSWMYSDYLKNSDDTDYEN